MLVITMPARAEPMSPNPTPHCFEVKLARDEVLYIGEKANTESSSLAGEGTCKHHDHHGSRLKDILKQAVGDKQAKPWEEAIRNAFMPVTPKQSVSGNTSVHVTESSSPSKSASSFLLADTQQILVSEFCLHS